MTQSYGSESHTCRRSVHSPRTARHGVERGLVHKRPRSVRLTRNLGLPSRILLTTQAELCQESIVLLLAETKTTVNGVLAVDSGKAVGAVDSVPDSGLEMVLLRVCEHVQHTLRREH